MDDTTRPSRREALLGSAALASVSAVFTSRTANGQSRKDSSSNALLTTAQTQSIFGTRGEFESGVLSINLPRTDLHPAIAGTAMQPEAGFSSQITFQATGRQAIAKYEFVLLDTEVDAVTSALLQSDMKPPTTNINALHNHFLQLTPAIKHLHGTAMGNAGQLAQSIRAALAKSAQPFSEVKTGDTGLPDDQIAKSIGGKGKVSGRVLAVDIPRSEKISEIGIELKPGMQIDSEFKFQGIGQNGHAALVAEFVLLAGEVDAVARSLRDESISVMAIHNHELFVTPGLYYLHAFATGDPLTLAANIRKALRNTRSKFKQS